MDLLKSFPRSIFEIMKCCTHYIDIFLMYLEINGLCICCTCLLFCQCFWCNNFVLIYWPLFCLSDHLWWLLNKPFELKRSMMGQGLLESSSSNFSRSPFLLGPFLAATLKQLKSLYLLAHTILEKLHEICLSCNYFLALWNLIIKAI